MTRQEVTKLYTVAKKLEILRMATCEAAADLGDITKDINKAQKIMARNCNFCDGAEGLRQDVVQELTEIVHDNL